jgi:hypothetical protein
MGWKRNERRDKPRRRPVRSVPLLALLGYYAVLIGAAMLLMWLLPATRHALVAPIAAGAESVTELVTGRSSGARVGSIPSGGPFMRLELTWFAAIGALLLALPVAWVHMFTRRLRYDPSLVQSIIMLPIVVAGVVLVVKNSLALAFALAGIVAGVRFRQKLKEPQDAVYVLLALGIGLAAGVQALDVALSVSLIFNLVVLGLWRYDLSVVNGSQPMLATGDTSLIKARTTEDRQRIRLSSEKAAAGMDLDGVLIVYATDIDAASHGVEVSLAGMAKKWRLLEPVREPNGLMRQDVLVLLNRNEDPVDLLGELEERWSAHIAAAEYVPHRVRRVQEKDDDEDDDDE